MAGDIKVNAGDTMLSADQVLYKVHSMAGDIIHKEANVTRKMAESADGLCRCQS